MAVLVRSHLGAVSGPSAPFDEAAERLADEGSIRLNDGVLTIDVSEREAREILSDLLTPVHVGDERAFAPCSFRGVPRSCALLQEWSVTTYGPFTASGVRALLRR